MKQPKKPTRNQKEIISNNFLNWKEWNVVDESDFRLIVIHKATGKTKRLDKFAKRKR
jgi:hypothetical protein